MHKNKIHPPPLIELVGEAGERELSRNFTVTFGLPFFHPPPLESLSGETILGASINHLVLDGQDLIPAATSFSQRVAHSRMMIPGQRHTVLRFRLDLKDPDPDLGHPHVRLYRFTVRPTAWDTQRLQPRRLLWSLEPTETRPEKAYFVEVIDRKTGVVIPECGGIVEIQQNPFVELEDPTNTALKILKGVPDSDEGIREVQALIEPEIVEKKTKIPWRKNKRETKDPPIVFKDRQAELTFLAAMAMHFKSKSVLEAVKGLTEAERVEVSRMVEGRKPLVALVNEMPHAYTKPALPTWATGTLPVMNAITYQVVAQMAKKAQQMCPLKAVNG